MIPRPLKQAYYLAFRWPLRLNGWVYRVFRSPRAGMVRVHLGPGQKKYLPGWINLDANLFGARPDVWVDLRHPLPFRLAAVDAFYSFHVIEHFPDAFLAEHFRQMYRGLKPGGVIRIGVPNADEAFRRFQAGQLDWFGDWPDKRASAGGRLANFLLCRGEHLSLLTADYLEELAGHAGFVEIGFRQVGRETAYPDRFDPGVLGSEEESHPLHPHSLILEARKPN